MRLFLEAFGINDPAAARMPATLARDWPDEILDGYRKNPREILHDGFSPPDTEQLIVIRDIDFVSMCAHHLLPIHGKASIGYLPGSNVAGFSSLARLVDCYAHRLQSQERLTKEIADALHREIPAAGSACRIVARHYCLCARGAKKEQSQVVTLSFTGAFEENASLREAFLRETR